MHEPSSTFDTTTPAGQLMAATDWSATPIGDPASWPESLRVLVRTILSSRYPMLILWGEQFTQLYNDAYSALIGDQHPAAMGEDCRVTLAEGWPVLGPLIDEAMTTGVASWVPALQLLLDRAGYREEAYFSVSHAPAADDDGVTRGVLTVCSEVTEQVVGDRRLRLLQGLSLSQDGPLDLAEAAGRVVGLVGSDPLDVPFVAVYTREGDGLRRLAASASGLDLPERVDLSVPSDDWGLARAAAGAVTTVGLPPYATMTGGAFADPVTDAVALPLPSADPAEPLGVLLVGRTPSRALDELYHSFLELLVRQVGVALRNARAHEEERARLAALAELDRAKTEFFTNVSHEFRTPLTLMLGPLTDALAEDASALPPEQEQRVATAARAARRLTKLVNNLLTFSRVETGTARAETRVVDLAQLTTDLAAGFRSAVERGGLQLVVDCPPLPRPVAIDTDHWESVVTNLLSNALKFTFTGTVRVGLAADADDVVLEVADTGVGIPAEELPHLFERFRQVRGSRARSHEGSGIGLALVHELVALLDGEVGVSSEVGAGTTFRVRLPWRSIEARGVEEADAPVRPGATLRAALDEAEGWRPSSAPERPSGSTAPADGDRARVLVVDDNADMRDHVVRLLQGHGWDVAAAADGQEALDAVRREPPDLVLTDVMMPRVDGFELLRTLRADPRTATLPVVVLSARAGEGASAEGLDLGADDYVVKPFDSRDLLARLRTTLRLSRQRTRHVAELGTIADAAALLTSGRRIEDSLAVLVEQLRTVTGASQVAVRLLAEEERPALVVQTTAGADAVRATEVLREPVVGRGERELGAVEVALTPAASLRPQTRALLPALARVLAAAVEEGRQAEREDAVAAALQTALLPDRLPEVAGLELAATYRPAEQEVQVGGDWYDVLELPDRRVGLVIGDVAGHGLTSALVMGQLRAAVRAYALEGRGPAETIRALDEFVGRMPEPSFSTLFLGYLDVTSGDLVWCSAGHPPPVLRDAAGRVSWLGGDPAPPLGSGMADSAADEHAVVEPGAALVAYTDGLVEDRSHQLETGMPALLAAVTGAADPDASALLRTVLDLPRAARSDDLAVLAVRRTAGRDQATSSRLDVLVADVDGGALYDAELSVTLPRSPQASGLARRRVRPLLEDAGVADDVTFDLLVGLAEAVNNAVEHPVDPIRDEVVVRARVDAAARRVRLEVQDRGTWRERVSAMDRGHGATLMASAGEVTVRPGPDGTLVTLDRQL